MHYLGLCVRVFVLLALAAFTASFVLSNDQMVVLRLFPLPFEVDAPVYALTAILLIAGLAVGMGMGSLYSTGKILRLRRDLRLQSERVQAMQQEITALELERETHLHYPSARTPAPLNGFLPTEVVGR